MLGPSGSGKTTCLRLIAGFEQPTAGHIEIFGDRAEGVPPYRRNVNTVFQDYALFPHLNVARQRRLRPDGQGRRARPSGSARRKRRSRWSSCPATATRRPGQLSGGQRQRVALARALVNQPKVLLLDEPLGALDLKLRENMQEELKALQKSLGITFVFVTHDQGEALSMADRIAVFNDGRIMQLGTPEEIYKQPELPFRRRFRRLLQCAAAGFRRPPSGAAPLGEPRPEAVKIGGAGRLSATVVSRTYLGGTTRLGLDVDGQRINALVPAGAPLPAEGETVRSALPTRDLHLMEPGS